MAKVILTSKTSAMKSKSTFALLTLVIVFASCSTAYKSGQTPDDVYYSPTRPQDEYVRVDRNDDRMYRYDEGAYRDDRYLRMKVRDHRYDVLFDDYYSYNPYYYHYYNGNLLYNTPWSSYTYWNYYYNPYYSHYPVITVLPTTSKYNKPRVFDLSVYNTPQSTSSNPKAVNTYNIRSSRNSGNYRNSGSNAGDYMRNVFGSSGNNSNSAPAVRTSTNTSSSGNSSSNSSSSGSSSGGRGNARRGN